MGILRGLITLSLLLSFLAMVAWLFSGRNKHRFDAAANIPLEEASHDSGASKTLERKS